MVRIPLLFMSVAVLPNVCLCAPKPKDERFDNVYFPSAVGTKAVYLKQNVELSQYVIDDRVIDGNRIIELGIYRKDGYLESSRTLVVTDKGVFVTIDGKVKFDPPQCLLKAPLVKGSTWQFGVIGSDGDLLADKGSAVIVGEEAVEVHAGKYNSIRVDFDVPQSGGKPNKVSSWYAKGLGLVKETTNGVQTFELRSFRQKKN